MTADHENEDSKNHGLFWQERGPDSLITSLVWTQSFNANTVF